MLGAVFGPSVVHRSRLYGASVAHEWCIGQGVGCVVHQHRPVLCRGVAGGVATMFVVYPLLLLLFLWRLA